jgi:ABC-2 type transport system ATP-binding protein
MPGLLWRRTGVSVAVPAAEKIPLIETVGLTKQYRKAVFALNGLDLCIPNGQMYGLLGPDGAGKTTTLRILATVLDATSGQTRIGGYDIRRQAEAVRRMIGYMPQNFSLYPDLSVLENLDFFATVNGVRGEKKQERIERMLGFTRLGAFAKRRADQLSGGMKKKLALACAMLHEPKVLLLDEPSTGVDPVSRRELWLMLAQVVQEGVTVLVSTPYMDEAERCHQVGVLYGGKLLTAGTPAELQSALPFEIVEVKAKPRKLMRQVVSESSLVLQWRTIGDRLRLCVKDASKSVRALEATLLKGGAEIKVLRPGRKTMEDVFIHLVQQQRGQK